MNNCPGCGLPLNESVVAATKNHKSCPSCSAEAGRHVFHSTRHYGMRRVGDRSIIQSYCPECRATPKQAPKSPAFTC